MRTKVKTGSSELTLTRVLDAFAQALIDASDEEIIEVAKDLRMDPTARESAALAGVTYPARPQVSDFFDLNVGKELPAPLERIGSDPRAVAKHGSRRSEPAQLSSESKTPGGK